MNVPTRVEGFAFSRIPGILSIAMLVLVLSAGVVAASEPGVETAAVENAQSIGVVKTVEGSPEIIRADQPVASSAGSPVFLNDTLLTDGVSGIGISLNDGTTLSLGEDSELIIDDFVYEPAAGNVGLGMQMLGGTMSYLSGKIAHISPESVSVDTPTATIGIRGTKFLVKVNR